MDAASRDGEDAASCTATSESDLPGARMEIDTSVCVFTLAQARAGISIGYEVVIDESIPDVTPRAQDAGNCDQPDGSGLIPFELLAGGGQRYCICDVGLCRAMPTATTLVAGRFHHTFMWDGTNWTGPSDTGNPPGPPFPAGSYTLSVSAVGTWIVGGGTTPFRVLGTMGITLVP